MRANIEIDDQLLKKAFKLTKVKTKKALIHQALKEFIENHSKMNLLDLKGKIKFFEGYEYKKMRQGN